VPTHDLPRPIPRLPMTRLDPSRAYPDAPLSIRATLAWRRRCIVGSATWKPRCIVGEIVRWRHRCIVGGATRPWWCRWVEALHGGGGAAMQHLWVETALHGRGDAAGWRRHCIVGGAVGWRHR
jgi:hypothetical protein